MVGSKDGSHFLREASKRWQRSKVSKKEGEEDGTKNEGREFELTG